MDQLKDVGVKWEDAVFMTSPEDGDGQIMSRRWKNTNLVEYKFTQASPGA